jgi:hypothetical protein
MTSDIQPLNDTELEAVSGGGAAALPSLNANTSIVLPHIPQAKDLLTQEQITKLLSINFNPPVPHG